MIVSKTEIKSCAGDRENCRYTGLVIKSAACGSRLVTSATAIRSKEGGRNTNTDMSVGAPNFSVLHC